MNATATIPALHPEHLEYLRARGITPATIAANGLHSARPQDLARLAGRRVPEGTSGLEIPYDGCDGFARVRLFPPIPDGDGREQKFGQPVGSPVRLYVPAGVREILSDPARTLNIIEGEVKAVALTQAGFPAIGLGGVSNFRTKDLPDHALIPDLERITWAGRIVSLVPDSDAWTNEYVLLAVYRLARILEARGATVLVVKLATLPGEAKTGADDLLVAKGPAAFRRLQEKALTLAHPVWRPFREREKAQARQAEPMDAHPYQVQDGRLCRVRQTREGPVIEAICNFTATVSEEIVQDDGAEATRAFVIQGRLDSGEPLPAARVPAARFAGMTWVTEHWGLRAVVRAGQTTRDYLREAIQRLSPEAARRRVFTHTGWREIGGEWIYLTSSGAVGRDGFEVELGPELARYRLPSKAEDPVEAMRASLRLLTVAPLTVTAPLWAGVFRAPLASALPLDIALWVEAATGSMKSTLAALFLSHFGDFDRTHLSASWSSTANQLERRAFLLKDVVYVVDDYAPTALDVREMEAKAARLIRAQGNLAGRGRLRADLTERPAFPPRGLILSTGEQHPPGQSLLARTLLIEPRRQDIDLAALSEAQRAAPRLQHVMAAYITWLAPQLNALPPLLRETFEGARGRSVGTDTHLRVPEALAHLWVGLHCGLSFAQEIGACSSGEAEDLEARCWLALTTLRAAQSRLVDAERPSRRFLRVLLALVTQGRAVLSPKEQTGGDHRGGVEFLGWQDEGVLYLIPETAHQSVSRFCRDAGEPFPVRRERLQKDLALEGLSECDPGRHTKAARVGGGLRRVLFLKRPAVADLLGEDFPLPVVTSVTGSAE